MAQYWKFQRGHLPKMCDEMSHWQYAPSDAADARTRWEFMMVGSYCLRSSHDQTCRLGSNT
jgi:hypothetical protein